MKQTSSDSQNKEAKKNLESTGSSNLKANSELGTENDYRRTKSGFP